MKNNTVREIINKLNQLDQDAVLCRMENDTNGVIYSTVEMIKYIGETEYIDDAGDLKTGNVVGLY